MDDVCREGLLDALGRNLQRGTIWLHGESMPQETRRAGSDRGGVRLQVHEELGTVPERAS
jgi:hypothetical protein